MPTYEQVPYNLANPYSKWAYTMRMEWPKSEYSGRNAGAICMRNGAIATAWSDPKSNEHTEIVLLNTYKEYLNDVVWLYTELMPCGVGQGLKNCRGALIERVPNATIYFTAPYYEGSDREPEATAILGAGQAGPVKVKRKDLNAAAKAWREEVAQTHPIWDPVWGQDPLPPELVVDRMLFANLG